MKFDDIKCVCCQIKHIGERDLSICKKMTKRSREMSNGANFVFERENRFGRSAECRQHGLERGKLMVRVAMKVVVVLESMMISTAIVAKG